PARMALACVPRLGKERSITLPEKNAYRGAGGVRDRKIHIAVQVEVSEGHTEHASPGSDRRGHAERAITSSEKDRDDRAVFVREHQIQVAVVVQIGKADLSRKAWVGNPERQGVRKRRRSEDEQIDVTSHGSGSVRERDRGGARTDVAERG